MTQNDGVKAHRDASVVAGIAYHGVAGSSYDCLDALKALIQSRTQLPKAQILTADTDHALMVFTDIGDPIAIKSGFASGYGGAGPKTFSLALTLLDLFGAEIEEIKVEASLLERLDRSALTQADMDGLADARRVRPTRWHDYVADEDHERSRDGTLLREMRPAMPFGIIDHRLADLACTFWDDSDARLTLGYRRLEDAIRQRTGLKSHSTKLLNEAFGEKGPLRWPVQDPSERVGRLQLFTGAFMAFRNPRAHRVPGGQEALSEFLILNQLFLLEAEAEAADGAEEAGSVAEPA